MSIQPPPSLHPSISNQEDPPKTKDQVTLQLSTPLPYGVTTQTNIHFHLTIAERFVMVFLTTAAAAAAGGSLDSADGEGGKEGEEEEEELIHPKKKGSLVVPRGAVGVGGMVYAIPLKNSKETLTTPILLPSTTSNSSSSSSSMTNLETTERIARILARKVMVPVYVGNSMVLSGMGGGGSVEEEMGVVKAVVGVVGREVERWRTGS